MLGNVSVFELVCTFISLILAKISESDNNVCNVTMVEELSPQNLIMSFHLWSQAAVPTLECCGSFQYFMAYLNLTLIMKHFLMKLI